MIPGADGLYVLQLNADGLADQADIVGAATDVIDSADDDHSLTRTDTGGRARLSMAWLDLRVSTHYTQAPKWRTPPHGSRLNPPNVLLSGVRSVGAR